MVRPEPDGAHDETTPSGEARRDAVPAEMRLREAVKEQHGRPLACSPHAVARGLCLYARVLESLDHRVMRIASGGMALLVAGMLGLIACSSDPEAKPKPRAQVGCAT